MSETPLNAAAAARLFNECPPGADMARWWIYVLWLQERCAEADRQAADLGRQRHAYWRDQWRRADLRLPDEEGEYNVVLNGRVTAATFMFEGDYGPGFYREGRHGLELLRGVTHWQPMPAAPAPVEAPEEPGPPWTPEIRCKPNYGEVVEIACHDGAKYQDAYWGLDGRWWHSAANATLTPVTEIVVAWRSLAEVAAEEAA